MVVGLIGAFDRNNYGDLLMPIIFERQFFKLYSANDVVFKYFSLVESDMTMYGGHKTIPIKNLINNKDQCDIAIFVGGELLSADYSWMYINTLSNPAIILISRIIRKIFNKNFEKIAKKIIQGKTSNPWIYDKTMLSCNKIIYNTVGGRSIPNDYYTRKILASADYVSVRDGITLNECKLIIPDIIMVPDSVLSISYLFSDSNLIKLSNTVEINKIKKLDKYFVLQVNRNIGKYNVRKLVYQVELIWKLLNIKCLLVPIGYAQGHEDEIPLRQIYNLTTSPIEIIEDETIYNITYAISKAQFYIGTSLHGAITAISYKVPHIALTSRVPKLIHFLETWHTTPIIYTEVGTMCTAISSILNNPITNKLLLSSRKSMLSKVQGNFSAINDLILIDDERRY